MGFGRHPRTLALVLVATGGGHPKLANVRALMVAVMAAVAVACSPAPPAVAGPPAHLSGRVDFGGCGGAAPATGPAPCSYVVANGAAVVLTGAEGLARNTVADKAGRYSFTVPAGGYSVQARVEGWSPPSSPYPTTLRISAQSSVRQVLLASGESVTQNLVIIFSPA